MFPELWKKARVNPIFKTEDKTYSVTLNVLSNKTNFILGLTSPLNVAKTETMVIATKQKLARLNGDRIQVSIDGETIKNTTIHKLLGLVLDESLDWNSNIDMICKKVSKWTALLKSIKNYLFCIS